MGQSTEGGSRRLNLTDFEVCMKATMYRLARNEGFQLLNGAFEVGEPRSLLPYCAAAIVAEYYSSVHIHFSAILWSPEIGIFLSHLVDPFRGLFRFHRLMRPCGLSPPTLPRSSS